MIIAIPSKGRPGKVSSQKILPSSSLFVPESERAEYVRLGGRNVIGIPDDVRGITRTRNWILENTPDEWVIMVDDDVKSAGWIKLRETTSKHMRLTESQWINEMVRLFEVTESLGYRIFGISTDGAPRSVYPYKPFIFRTYVTASFMGIINKGIRFDETFPVKEDYELCLRCIKEDGGILGARYLYWNNSHWIDAGGCADYRTQSMERLAIRRLLEMYPGMIRQVTRGGSSYSIQLEF